MLRVSCHCIVLRYLWRCRDNHVGERPKGVSSVNIKSNGASWHQRAEFIECDVRLGVTLRWLKYQRQLNDTLVFILTCVEYDCRASSGVRMLVLTCVKMKSYDKAVYRRLCWIINKFTFLTTTYLANLVEASLRTNNPSV